ncbi:FliM/FliN family flagellar motor switch protein [Planctomycetota bacterium]
MAEEAQAVEEKPSQQTDSSPSDTKQQAQSVEFSEAVEADVVGAGGSIDILLDMKVPVTVTIGHTEIPVQRFLRLGPGSVLKLNKSIDEPVDLYLRDAKYATGSVVVVDGRFAVKIKQVLSLGDSADNPKEATD